LLRRLLAQREIISDQVFPAQQDAHQVRIQASQEIGLDRAGHRCVGGDAMPGQRAVTPTPNSRVLSLQATKEVYTNLVDTMPAAHACCKFLSSKGAWVPCGGTTSGRANGPDSPGGPTTGPSQLM
jgi:hypothetical protein